MLNLILIAMTEPAGADRSGRKAQHISCLRPHNLLAWVTTSSPTCRSSPAAQSFLLQVSPGAVVAEINTPGKSSWAVFYCAAMSGPATSDHLSIIDGSEQPNSGAVSQTVMIQKTRVKFLCNK